MAMNRIQFQPGLSLPAFLAHFGAETQCEEALELSRWPHLETLSLRLIVSATACGARPAKWLRQAEESC